MTVPLTLSFNDKSSQRRALQIRPADPVADLAFAYDVFKRTTMGFVKELSGSWPEQSRYEFFKKGFGVPNTYILSDQDKPVGCFCIAEDDKSVILQRMYLEPAYQRQGIGHELMGLALQKAHEVRKPLELEVLENNKPAIEAYKKNGFEAYELVVKDWNRKLLMRQKDTAQYAAPAVLEKTSAAPALVAA